MSTPRRPLRRFTEAAAKTTTAWDDMSLDDRSSAVYKAVNAKFNPLSPGGYCCSDGPWLQAIFDTSVPPYVVLKKDSTLYRMDLAIDDAGAVTLVSDIVPVRINYVPLAESTFESPILFPLDDSGHLLEGDAKPSGKQWAVLIITEGMSLNRNNYRRSVLDDAAPLYEGAKIFMDHQESVRKFGRSTGDVAGFLKDVHGLTLPTREAAGADHARYALAGTACITNANVRQQLLDAYEMGKPDLFGLSHDVQAESQVVMDAKGKAYYDVLRIAKVDSVDFVTNPAAGGRVVRLVASNVPAETLQGDERMLTKIIEAIKKIAADEKRPELLTKLGESPTEDLVMSVYQEALTKPAPVARTREASMKACPDCNGTGKVDGAKCATCDGTGDVPKVAAKKEAVLSTLTEAEVTALREQSRATRVTMGTLRVDAALAPGNCALPQILRDELRTEFMEAVTREGAPELTDLVITARLKRAVETWGKLVESKVVLPASGLPHVQMGQDSIDKAKKRLDDFFDTDKPAVSFKECYIDLTGDTKVTGRLNEAVRLRESVSSGTFDQILGDSITRRMQKLYVESALQNWKGIVADVVPLSDFRLQRRMRLGGYGNLPTVGEGQPYTALTSPTDEEATYSPAKRGGTESITLEAIKNDDIGVIRRIPQLLARAAAHTIHEFVWDFFATNANIYDSVALAASGHNNYTTSALSETALKAQRLLMTRQTDMSSGKRLGLAPKYLIVPGDLEELSFQLTNSDKMLPDSSLASTAAPAAPSFVRKLNITPLTIGYWTDVNNWWLVGDINDTPLLEVGFLDGNEQPDLFVQDMPNVGSMFSNDRITYKIRHIYGGGVLDYRGIAGAIVP